LMMFLLPLLLLRAAARRDRRWQASGPLRENEEREYREEERQERREGKRERF
jgi:hypothetical protein